MEESRTRNATRNILSGAINKIATILVPFITRTILINYLGSKYLGLNSLFTSILQILNLAELGFGQALVYSMYKPIAEKNEYKVKTLLNYYKKVYKIIGIVILTLGIGILPFINNFITGGYPDEMNIYIIYGVYLINTVISYFMYAYKSSLLIANQRNDITTNINAILVIIQNIIQSLIIILMKNYYYYIILLPITTIVNNLITAKICDKKYPQYIEKSSKKLKLEEEEKKEITKNTKGMIFQKIGGVILRNVDDIVISSFLGLSILGIYNNYYYILMTLFGMLDIIMNSLKSSVGNSIVLETKEKNYKDFIKFNFLYVWIISWMTLTFAFLVQDFIKLWLGEAYLLSNSIVILFAIYFYIHKWCDILYVYQEARGLWWENRYVPFIAAIVNLVINIVLVNIIGLPGILISTIVSVLFVYDVGYAKVLFKKYFNIKGAFLKYVLRQIKYFAVIFIVGIITYIMYVILGNIINNIVIRFAVKIVLIICIPNILFYLLFRNFKEYKDASDFLSNLILRLSEKNRIIKKVLNKINPILVSFNEIGKKNLKKVKILPKKLHSIQRECKIKNIEEIYVKNVKNEYKWVGAVQYNNNMYCIPSSINAFLKMDLKDNKTSLIEFNPIKMDKFNWTGGCVYNNKIYAFPRKANTLLELNPETDEIKEIPLGINYEQEHHYAGVCTKQGIVYQPPRNNNTIFIINLNDFSTREIKIGGNLCRYKYLTGIQVPSSGLIYFFPERGERVLVLNPETERFFFIGKKLNCMVFDVAIGIDGNLYGFSGYEKGILKINPETQETEMICPEVNEGGCYGSKLGVNGKIYGVPGLGKYIWEFDVEKQQAKKVYEIEKNSDINCAGGIVAKDGTIYTVPAKGNTIYKITFDNKKEIEKNELDSIYFTDNY